MNSYNDIALKLDEIEQEVKRLVELEDFEACSQCVATRFKVLQELDSEYQRLTHSQSDKTLFDKHKEILETVQKNDQLVLQRLATLSSSLVDDRSKHLKAKRAVNFYKKTLSSF